MKRWALLLFGSILLGIGAVVSAGGGGGGESSETVDFPNVSEEDPTYAVEWMTLLYDRAEAQAVSAPAGSRLYGYAGVALYESVVNFLPGNSSLIGQITSLGDLPYPDEGVEYDGITVSISTMQTVFNYLVPNATDEGKKSPALIDALAKKQIDARRKLYSDDIIEDSVDYGKSLGEELNVWIQDDGYDTFKDLNAAYELPTGEDRLWVKTNPDLPIAEPSWGQLRPFAMGYADECAVWSPRPDFSVEEDSTFYAQAMEVKETGDNLTEEQKEIARFWIDTPGQTGTPSGHWVSIESQLVKQLDLPLARTAEMYALVGIALADSFISTWSLKYQDLLIRPETYINLYIDRRWRPYLATPNFPEYPSGHSTTSAAAAEVLTAVLGIVSFTDSTGLQRDLAPRSFTTIQAAASEAAISRLYGGIHYRTAIENGMVQGRCIGALVNQRFVLNPQVQGE
jgi:hypothetical protein